MNTISNTIINLAEHGSIDNALSILDEYSSSLLTLDIDGVDLQIDLHYLQDSTTLMVLWFREEYGEICRKIPPVILKHIRKANMIDRPINTGLGNVAVIDKGGKVSII